MAESYVLMRLDGSYLKNGAGFVVIFHSLEEAASRRDKANSWAPKNPYQVVPANFAKDVEVKP